VYVESFNQRSANAVTVHAAPHPVVGVKITTDNHFGYVGQKIKGGSGQGVGGGLQMLNLEKPCTAMPRTSRLLLRGKVASFFEKSKDVLRQTIRPPPFPLEGGRSLRST